MPKCITMSVIFATLGVALSLLSARPLRAAEDPVAATAKPTINVLLVGYYIWVPSGYVELCRKEGINIYGPLSPDPSGADPANYPVEFLKKFHLVIASGPLEKAWDPQVIRTAIKPGIVANLLEYNRQGGGLIWTPLGAGYGANSWTENIGTRIDAVALDEALTDPSKELSVSVMASFRDRLRYIRTNDITPHPVTEGVRGLFFGRTGEWSWPGTIPMKFGPSWQVLVRGMDTTRTTVNGTPPGSGKREFTYTGTTGTYTARPELIAVRKDDPARTGRMLLQPIYTTWTWGNYKHPAMKDAFLLNGDGIYPSDGQRFLLNALRWLAEPAQAAGGFGGYQPPQKADADKPVDLSPVVWSEADWKKIGAEPTIRGLFGAQSRAGGGNGTVAQWAAAARAAGLSYLVFTDDVNRHTPESYAALVAESKAQSDEKFAILPGWGGYDVNGVYRFFPGAPTLPDRKHFDAQGRMTEPAGITVDYAWRIGQVVAEMGKMPYNPWWEHVIMACAPLTYEGTTLVDDGVARWLSSCEPHQTTLLPMSLVRVKSPEALGAAVKGAHLTMLRTDKVGEIQDFARKGAGGQTMPSYLTNGPLVPVWRHETSPGEPFRPASSRFRILLKTTSAAGLAEVKITDVADGSVYRLWKPAGQQEFTAAIDESTVKQRVLALLVTDVNGRTAVAPPIYTYQGANRSWQMGDRLMGMHHTTSWDPARKRLVTHGTPAGISYHKGSPDGGGEFTTDHISQLKFQGLEGSGIYPPAFKINPILFTDRGQEPVNTGMRFAQILAGHDLAVFDYVGDQQYPYGQRFVFNGVPRIPQDTKLATIVSRNWLLRTRYMAPISMEVNEIIVTFKQDVTLQRLHLGRYHGPDAPGEFNFLTIKPTKDAPALAWQFEQGEEFSRTTEFTPGGYLYQGKALAGTMGFIALDDKVACQSKARGHDFQLSKKYLKAYRAGDTLTIRMLRVSRAYEAQQGSNDWLEKFLRDYGIATAPAYAPKVTQGTLTATDYILDLQAQDGGAAVEIGKYDLPEPLPIRVSGVRQAAVLGEYDLDTKRVRPLPYLDGTVTVSLETQLKATRLYVGEWVSWDNNAARVSLVPDGMDFLLEAHNPTGQEIVCTVTGAPGFTPLTGVRKELRIPPYSSVKEKLISAPGTVKLEPMR
jgi:hypothetical protein